MLLQSNQVQVVCICLFLACITSSDVSDAFAIIHRPHNIARLPIVVRSKSPSVLKSSAASHEVHWLVDDDNDGDGDDYDNYLYDDLYDDLDDDGDGEKPLGEAIAKGEAVVYIPDIASQEECQFLFSEALGACENSREVARGRNRFSVSDPTAFSNDVVLSCDEILLRVLDYLDVNIPSIYTTLFRSVSGEDWLQWQPLSAQLEEPTVPPSNHLLETCEGIRDLYMMGELEWSEGEPAINVYQTEGYFGGHKDHLALTVLIPLTSPENFEGGGTGFWAGNRNVDENPQSPPTTILKPSPGSALIFGGDVTHSGMPVEAGLRSVFVCSFSTRTPASAEDRLHGLQAPPVTSPNFKGSM